MQNKKRFFCAALAALLIILTLLPLCGCTGFLSKKGNGTVETERTEFSDGSYTLALSGINLPTADGLSLRIAPDEGAPFVSVTADENILESLHIEVDESKREIRISGSNRYIYRPTDFNITVSADLTGLSLAGMMEADMTLSAPSVTLNIDGTCTGKAKITAEDSFSFTVNGASSLELAGTCDALDAEINGAARVDAYELSCRKAAVTLNGTGKAELCVSDTLDAEINGLGKIVYRGDPDKVTPRINGLGKIVSFAEDQSDSDD